MANIGSIKFKKKVKPDEIEKLLNDINNNIFQNAFIIKRDSPPEPDEIWFILTSKDEGYEHVQFDFWCEGRKLRWYDRGDDIVWWCREFIANKIASNFEGAMMTDDGVGENWKPYFHEKYPTILSWVCRGRNPIANQFLKEHFDINDVPPSLRSFIGG